MINHQDVDESKKIYLLERLNHRNQERKLHLEEEAERKNKDQTETEDSDYIAQTFATTLRDIEARLENLSDSATKKSNADAATTAELSRHIAEIATDIQELQRYLTNCTMYLSDYKIKACQQILTELQAKFDETKYRLLPKKKFGFSAKKAAAKSPLDANATKSNPQQDLVDKALKPSVYSSTIENRSNAHVQLLGSEVNGKDITITKMQNCLIELQGHAGSVQISNASDCIVLCGPIERSLFVEHCKNCIFVSASQQVRVHSCVDCKLHLHVTCRAIIEDCREIDVGSYNYDYADIEQDFTNSGLDRAQNNYTDVADFNWLSPDAPSPNWRLLDNQNAKYNWLDYREQFIKKYVAT